MTLDQLLLTILGAPLVSATLIWLFLRRQHGLAAALSVGAAGLACAAVLYLILAGWDGQPYGGLTLPWLTLGDLTFSAGFLLDGVTAIMLFVVAFVGFWIHVFSLGYMADDEARARFFGGLSIFMFSMFGIVVADNLFMIFVFWELVGFSSYLLIGHYLKTPEARDASKKAFVVNRIGDFGFLLGIIMIYQAAGTTNLQALEQAAVAGGPVTTWAALLLFCGVLGKSAQMPLHVWLPDAMAGPTPISALIHAATMVAAGVFLLARTWSLYPAEALEVIAWIGVVTAVCAAFWAFAQRDIKRILAYSTLSQLGYMVAGFAFGTLLGKEEAAAHAGDAALAGAAVALFHLTTHAFFKALLFLGSGAVIHACHHEQDIFRMGGLAKKMPITTATFALGLLALAAVPFVGAGFFSKDLILLVAHEVSPVAFWLLAATAVMTAAYMARLFVVAFLGQPKTEAAEHAHEVSWVMWLPLVILAVLSVLGGYLGLYPTNLGQFFSHLPHADEAEHTFLLVVSAVAAVVGLSVGALFYRPGAREDRLEKVARPLWAASRSRFYFDEIYGGYVRYVHNWMADVVALLDLIVISGLIVRGSAGGVGLFGVVSRSFHTGNAGSYLWWFLAGAVIFWAYTMGLLGGLVP